MSVTISGELINIIPPSLAQPFYEYALERPTAGPRITGKLTYDLLGKSQTRTLLRLDSRFASKIWTLSDIAAFRDLTSGLDAKATGNLGSISVHKGLVVDLNAGQQLPGITVGVHRFGPVAVALIPGKPIVIPHLGAKIAISPAVYATFLVGSNSDIRWSKYDILRSCKTKFDWLLTAYLEEVGEEFFDIEHHASKTDVFRRLKHAETILAESVDSKLQIIQSHAFHIKEYHLHAAARALWDKYDVMIIVAALARVFALFFINEMYRFLGIMDRSETYQGRWQESVDQFRNLSGVEAFDRLIDRRTNSEISILNEAIRRYWDETYDGGFEDLIGAAQPRLWLERFVGFADFVSSLRKEKTEPHIPRLFFSAQHRQEAASGFVNSARLYVSSSHRIRNEDPAQVTLVHQERSGENIEKLVKTKIWSSHAVVGVIPKKWMDSKPRKDGPLEWVARETDHGLLIQRHVQLFLEEDVERDNVSAEFGNDFHPLSPATGRIDPDERKRKLQEQVKGIVNSSFRYIGTRDIEGSAREGLDAAILRARDSMCKELIHGFLEQFPSSDRTTLARVLHVAKYDLTKSQIVRRLVDVFGGVPEPETRDSLAIARREKRMEEKFVRARRNLHKRRLKVRGEVFELITRTQKGNVHAYRGNLRRILALLRPELAEEEIEQLHHNILTREMGPIDPGKHALGDRRAS